ncbi:MAG: DUF1926 domain-containing protein, partial [Omnitrophica bacterium]|nr:DUF1926 domain-containing protein [Candidatus Omnitrophota bacterium]
LYMGQCNCPYWHGVFGGIYLGHLRHITYKNLLTAQSLAEQKKESRWIEIETFDFDKDGTDELIIKNPLLNVFITPKLGGGIFELDYIPKCVNLMDVMTRRPEAYHQQIKTRVKKTFRLKKKKVSGIHDLLRSKEKGLTNFLVYDAYRRLSLLDHFLPKKLSLKEFKQGRYEELGEFIGSQYSVRQEETGQQARVILERVATVNYKGSKIPITITKQLSLNNKDAQIAIEYTLQNLTAKPLEAIFAVEFNISSESQEHPNHLCSQAGSEEKTFSLKEDVTVKEIKELCLKDELRGVKVSFSFDKKPDLWSHPLETISASEEGFERNYQQTVIVPHWSIKLEKSWQTKIIFGISSCNLSNL